MILFFFALVQVNDKLTNFYKQLHRVRLIILMKDGLDCAFIIPLTKQCNPVITVQ